MQKLCSELIGGMVFGIQNGQEIGRISNFVVSSSDLKIIAYVVEPNFTKNNLYLLPGDIRLMDGPKVLVNSEENLSEFDELIRFQHAITENYKIITSRVITSSGKRIGKVIDFMFDSEISYITKISVVPTLLKKLLVTNLLIDRADIVDTKPGLIIVKDNLVKSSESSAKVLAPDS